MSSAEIVGGNMQFRFRNVLTEKTHAVNRRGNIACDAEPFGILNSGKNHDIGVRQFLAEFARMAERIRQDRVVILQLKAFEDIPGNPFGIKIVDGDIPTFSILPLFCTMYP